MAKPYEDWLHEIEEPFEAEDFEKALDLIDQAIEEYPDDSELFALRGDAEWALDDVISAQESYQEAVRIEPNSSEFLGALSRIHFALCDFFGATRYAKEALKFDGSAEALDVLSRLAERSGRIAESDKLALRAHQIDDETFNLPFRMEENEFREAANEALEALPERFLTAIRDGNVAILVEPFPQEEILIEEAPPFDPTILGLYRGVPLPERDAGDPGLPDVIHIFQHNIERVAMNREDLVREITITVYHELGHFFGLDEDQLADLDLA
ncbi:MAG: tetratricopeptide repeat protein [Gemmatimonadetes bacterium]|nr:tetratricopeptide repeat protein [Gemmatimonadota bacterium]